MKNEEYIHTCTLLYYIKGTDKIFLKLFENIQALPLFAE
jgi:hypothetical protein